MKTTIDRLGIQTPQNGSASSQGFSKTHFQTLLNTRVFFVGKAITVVLPSHRFNAILYAAVDAAEIRLSPQEVEFLHRSQL